MVDQQTTTDNQQGQGIASPENQVEQAIEQLVAELEGVKGQLRVMKFGMGLLGIITVGLASVFVTEQLNQERLVMFNVKDTTNNFLQQVAQLNLDDNQKKSLVSRYQRNLNEIVKEYEDEGIIVLSTSAILTPVEDKTAEIKAKIAKRMKTTVSDNEQPNK